MKNMTRIRVHNIIPHIYNYRTLTLGTNSVLTKQDETRLPVELEEFKNNPGVYYEKIGRLHQIEATWKLVITLDLTKLDDRAWQINKYMNQTNEICDHIKFNSILKTCENLKTITDNDLKTLMKIINSINTLYKTPTNRRRGLINGVGSITKALFGIMDANDRKLINEQITLLANKQHTLEHATKNQIRILNTTIIHLNKLENILDYNGKLINHYLREYTTREELDEHFTVITAMLSDLIRDAKEILEYLTHVQKGMIYPLLTPVSEIISYLKEAVLQLPHGSYFPFVIKSDEWLTIEKYMEISAYCDNTKIYTILKFPIIAQPEYEILNVIPLPIFNNENKFMYVKIENKLIAINKETNMYLALTDEELKKCTQNNNQYLCKKNRPIYHVNMNTACEIKIYVQKANYREPCNFNHMIAKRTIWITLRQPHSWLYSTATEEQITINCDNNLEYKKTIKKSGRITIHDNCKITSTDVTIQTDDTNTYSTIIESFLPEYNITFPHNNKPTDGQNLKDIIDDPLELKDAKNKLEEINQELDKNQNNFLTQEQFIYPMAGSGLVTIIIIILITWIIIQHKKKKPKKPIVTIVDEIDKCYGMPKPILKRSKSTRF